MMRFLKMRNNFKLLLGIKIVLINTMALLVSVKYKGITIKLCNKINIFIFLILCNIIKIKQIYLLQQIIILNYKSYKNIIILNLLFL